MYHYLLIEFLDELIFGLREAAWPQIRNDLQLSYTQIGILLGLPGVASSLIEPFLGILSDRGKRNILIFGGGVIYAFSLLLTGVSQTYFLLLLSFVLFYPASGAFVSLSQTVIMDKEPDMREKNMAKWAFSGSLGVVTGPLFFSGILLLGGNWRTSFLIFSGLAIFMLLTQWKRPAATRELTRPVSYTESFRVVLHALQNVNVLRWLILLICSDMMLDVLLGYLTLYFVDVISVTQYQAGIAVGVWAAVGMVGDFLIIHLLNRVPGLVYLKRSATITLLLFPAFLLIPGYGTKLLLIGCLGLFNAGWYSILKAQLYNTLPNNSGLVLALSNIFGLIGVFIPWCVGLIADQFGLLAAMWILLLGPIGMILGLTGTRTKDHKLV